MTSTSGILSPDALEKIYKKLESRDQATVTALITCLASTNGENEECAFVASSTSGEGAESKMAETRKSKRRADEMDQTGHENESNKRPALSRALSLLESLPVDPMVNVCEFLDLPTRWRLSRCNKALEKFITADCKALWRHLSVRSAGVSELSDETVAAIFEKVNAHDVTLTLNLENCSEITGRCLEPLRHSRVLESISFAREAPGLNYEMVTDILRTMLPHNLHNVTLPTPYTTEITVSADTNSFFHELHGSNLRAKGLSCKLCETISSQSSRALNWGSQGICERCQAKEELAPSDVFETQPDISARMRAILVDWLVELHYTGFKADCIKPETLYVAVNLIDRYLEKKEVARSKLQLVGITSFLIAFKHVEIYVHPPPVSDMAYFCDNSYTEDEVIAMEQDILKVLQEKVIVPTAYDFLACFQWAIRADKRTFQLSSYVLDGTLLSYDLNKYLPSELAAAAVFIARQTVGLTTWGSSLVQHTKCSKEKVASVARAIIAAKLEASSSQFATRLEQVTNKYTHDLFGGVARIVLASIPE